MRVEKLNHEVNLRTYFFIDVIIQIDTLWSPHPQIHIFMWAIQISFEFWFWNMWTQKWEIMHEYNSDDERKTEMHFNKHVSQSFIFLIHFIIFV